MELSTKDKKAYEAFLETVKRIQNGTKPPKHESPEQKQKRITELLGSHDKFCNYYFPHLVKAPFGWFHRKAAKEITNNPNIFTVLEWPREHAKSVFADIQMPLYLKAKGELTGMIISSANNKKAKGLLSDIQAELEGNQRYINDFGNQVSLGDWADGTFTTTDGVGFWAFGRGESPRGTRKGEKRPNYIVVDDIDDAEICRNEARVQEALDWVLGDLFYAGATKGCRFIIVGNRIHKKSILAHIVGDTEEGKAKRQGIYHLKVFALENSKTHEEDQSIKGVPAWKENYTREQITEKMEKSGYRVAQRELFHKQITEGLKFKEEWIKYTAPPKLTNFQVLITYTDPSFKDTKKNDYKAIVLIGKIGMQYHLIDCWVRQANTSAMVKAHYDMYEQNGSRTEGVTIWNFIEGGFIQDLFIEDYKKEAETRNYMLPIRPDERKKPKKEERIEQMTTIFERGFFYVNEKLRGSIDYQNWLDQLLGFPNAHDDAPDATEGAVFIANQKTRTDSIPQMGQRTRRKTF